jgi:asparagine synthase (glutamine-hydrolysing)
MCGIAGKLVYEREARVGESEIMRMIAPIAHRGPDGRGVHVDRNVGLGHCRLSIIDLNTGAQPMANEDETIWIVFNGEIYNFPELRERLVDKGHVFRSRSDTEVIIHAYEEFGVECVNQLRGMFAFAIWDSRRQRLFLARDRVGIKPLYYCQTAKGIFFASELKGILVDPEISRDLDYNALRAFLAFKYVPGDKTLFKSVRKLPPGHCLVAENGQVAIRQYWDLRFTRDRWSQSFEETTEELHALLQDTVRDHMIADVPVGVLLSGGVDSSAVLNFAVRETDKKVNTFTVGFDGGQVVDERPYARLAAQRFGTEHHEISITEKDFWDFLPAYMRHMEEPVCEPPAVALYYVSRLARDHVKVVLSGEGGDEGFGGYPNYPNMMRLERIRCRAGAMAGPIGKLVMFAGRMSGDQRAQRYGAAFGQPLSSQYFSRTSGPTSFFNQRAGTFLTSELLANSSSIAPAEFVRSLLQPVSDESLLNQMLYVDSKTWLPDDLLVKADKMTMANSLELRVPLLDHKLLEFAASLPADFKVQKKQTKRILKAAFARALPEEILNRKKAGFPTPYESWLRNGLRNGIEDILLSDRALSRNYFNRQELERLLKTNAGAGGYAKEVFSLLAIELWHQQFIDAPATPANKMIEVGEGPSARL